MFMFRNRIFTGSIFFGAFNFKSNILQWNSLGFFLLWKKKTFVYFASNIICHWGGKYTVLNFFCEIYCRKFAACVWKSNKYLAGVGKNSCREISRVVTKNNFGIFANINAANIFFNVKPFCRHLLEVLSAKFSYICENPQKHFLFDPIQNLL